MTVCGHKLDGVCTMGECPYVKLCCNVKWDKRKLPPTRVEKKPNVKESATWTLKKN